MSLSCECEWYPEPGEWAYYSPNNYTTLETSRRKRCRSCKELIDIGAIVIAFDRYRVPNHDVEINIYGEDGEIPIAAWYHCEECADLYFSLTELGFCGSPNENQHDLVEEYAEEYGNV